MSKATSGFASLTPEQRRRTAHRAGVISHRKGKAHEWTVEEAREAGRKGGAESQRRKREAKQGHPVTGN